MSEAREINGLGGARRGAGLKEPRSGEVSWNRTTRSVGIRPAHDWAYQRFRGHSRYDAHLTCAVAQLPLTCLVPAPHRCRERAPWLPPGLEARIECHPAVDEDAGAGDVIGLIRGQPRDHAARARALISVPSGCGLELGTIALPSGATMRLRPPRRWNRIGMRREVRGGPASASPTRLETAAR